VGIARAAEGFSIFDIFGVASIWRTGAKLGT
jgi:hypothetical protein